MSAVFSLSHKNDTLLQK